MVETRQAASCAVRPCNQAKAKAPDEGVWRSVFCDLAHACMERRGVAEISWVCQY